MRTSVAMGLAIAVATGHPFAQATTDELRLGRSDGGLFTVQVAIADHGPLTFLLDTGSQRTIVTPAVARMAGLTVYPGARLLTSAGARDAGQAWAPTLRIGHIALANHPLIVADVNGVGRGSRAVDGILGHDVLGRVDYRLDTRRGRLTLGESADAVEDAVVLPFVLDRGRIVVEVRRSPETRPLRMVLDSGATNAVFRRSALDRTDERSRGAVRVRTASTVMTAASTDAIDLTIGGQFLRVPRAVILDGTVHSDTDGLLP